jgi:acetyl-CoA acyltransferase
VCTLPTSRPKCSTHSCSAQASIPEIVDDVIWGCVGQTGEQTFDIARTALLAAGWHEGVPGVTIDRQCGSSQQSVHFAAAGLVAGHYDVVVAGGMESIEGADGCRARGWGRPIS